MYILTSPIYFPPHETANEDGILALGGDLSEERLLFAYRNGIFPWYNEDEPIIWWSPQMRMVVDPKNYKPPKTIRNLINRNTFQVTYNQCFEKVIEGCKTIIRKDQLGTWLTDEMKDAYIRLHQIGYAKSIEVWQNNELVGGLYGVDLGNFFVGESMFSRVSNASKIAFVWLVNHLKNNDYLLLDCQVHNHYLEQLGAFEITRNSYLKIIQHKSLEYHY
jgi:leucyl/phenylalanyl-tRNA--protein transferase